ncbi:unnamed protein product [Mytilus coruscus]|uniref:Putative nuclease HARBI1 n=1 Tax=Mytilus coruscus TaxID=42192 RepID=A0A6J8ATG7_MYTCO|nr:unnamed protein product [Mytilus coruscus]
MATAEDDLDKEDITLLSLLCIDNFIDSSSSSSDETSGDSMPGVVGAIDGTHIAIPGPNQHHENYINRKGFHSIVAQVVCDHEMTFMSVNTGWPGSVHDARVFRNSKIGKRIINKTILPDEFHLVGDAAYPLSQNLMTPFKDFGTLTREQQRYSFVQSSTRMVVERSIGQLKGRFRKLKMLDCALPKSTDSVTFCCILHNICITEGDILNDEEIIMDDHVNNGPGLQGIVESGNQKRNNLVILFKIHKYNDKILIFFN